jgi:hypothetical protein
MSTALLRSASVGLNGSRHADLCMLARLSQTLARARAVPLAA